MLEKIHQHFNCILLSKGKKSPVGAWKPETYIKPSLDAWLKHNGNYGVLCGKANDGLEVMDFDWKNYLDGEKPADLMQEYQSILREQAGGLALLKRCVIVRTQSGGFHIYYKTSVYEGNKKLANNKLNQAFIETRGQGGLVVCPPTVNYEVIHGNYFDIPFLSSDERRLLIDSARGLNQYFRDKEYAHEASIAVDTDNPFTAANMDGQQFLDEIVADGWKTAYQRGTSVYLVRPGKNYKDGGSAWFQFVPTVGVYPFLFNYSSSAEVDPDIRLSYVDYLLVTRFRGDKKDVRDYLLKKGYGKDKYKNQPKHMHERPDIAPEEFIEEIDAYEIREDTEVPDDTPIVWIKQQQFLTYGNVSAISGVQKTGKSAISSVILSKMINPKADTFPSIQVTAPNGKAIIHIDTEQSKAKQKKNLISWVLDRAGVKTVPQNFHSYHFRSFTTLQSRDNLSMLMKRMNIQHKGIHLVVVDGIADFVRSVNDMDEVTELLKQLSELSDVYECAILVNIHTNASSAFSGDHKPTGHLGSTIAKKCEGCVTIFHDKDSPDTSIMVPYVLRDGSVKDFGEVYYSYNKMKYRHEEIIGEEAEDLSGKNKHLKLLRKICDIVKGSDESDATLDLMNEFDYSASLAGKKIKECIKLGFLILDAGILKLESKI